jgi:[methyl-Co(III) methanol-specific corrinoid protein]:coenzyme M methyltransferase
MPVPDFESGRARVLIEALTYAADRGLDLPVVGNLVGPFSLLGMLADPLRVLRWTRRQPQDVHRYMDRLADDLVRFGGIQAEAGADAVCIAEPTATGEILGGTLFAAFVAPYLARIAERLRAAGTRVILHVCGDARPIEAQLTGLPVEAVSFDSMVNIVAVARKGPPWQVMGNVSAFALEDGPAGAIAKWTRSLAAGGVRLLSPACGVVPTTPVAHLRAMREAADG